MIAEPENFDIECCAASCNWPRVTTETNRSTTNNETSSNNEPEPEPELSMTELIHHAAGRSYLQPDQQPSETTKPRANDVFNEMIHRDAHSSRQFSSVLPVFESSSDQTEDAI
jgi:hypothetical protein